MLARIHGVDEGLGMQMLRSGDEDGVKRWIVEKLTVIGVRSRGGREFQGVFEAARVNVGKSRDLGGGAGEGFAGELRAAVANADDADADAVVCAENAASGERAGQAGSDVADEVPSGLHRHLEFNAWISDPGYRAPLLYLVRRFPPPDLRMPDNPHRIRSLRSVRASVAADGR